MHCEFDDSFLFREPNSKCQSHESICLKKRKLDHPFHYSVYVQMGSLPIDEDRVCHVGVWVILCDSLCFEFCITSTM